MYRNGRATEVSLLSQSVVQADDEHVGPECAMLVRSMRDPEIIEAELMEISAVAG